MPSLFGWGASRAAERRLADIESRRAEQHAAAVKRRKKAKRGGKR